MKATLNLKILVFPAKSLINFSNFDGLLIILPVVSLKLKPGSTIQYESQDFASYLVNTYKVVNDPYASFATFSGALITLKPTKSDYGLYVLYLISELKSKRLVQVLNIEIINEDMEKTAIHKSIKDVSAKLETLSRAGFAQIRFN